MEQLVLRPPAVTDSVDPLQVAPQPGPMANMYLGARAKFPDGMTLAVATPYLPYQETVDKYVRESSRPGFSDVAFFEGNFAVEAPDNTPHDALPGESLGQYLLRIRELFIFPNTKQGHFDIKLPYDRSVAGIGRFGRHSFLWDGYQMAKGYAADKRWDLVQNVVDNTEFQINKFGHPLNGSADFYATRAQPDYFSHEVRMLADEFGPEVLVRYLPAMEKNHMGYWMDGRDILAGQDGDGKAHAHRTLIRMPDGSYLNRYWDDAEGPRLESFKEDVEVGELAVQGLAGAIREAKLAKVYKDLRAGAASGWDYSSRWFKDGKNLHTINTTDIAPVDLNSLMVYNEETLALAYQVAADKGGHDGLSVSECLEKAGSYQRMADTRKAAIDKYLWDPQHKMYRDFNFVDGHQTEIVSAAMAYPLYVGIASVEQSLGVMRVTERDLLYEGGIVATTTEESQEQWDGGQRGVDGRPKNVWAPYNWAYTRGAARMAHIITQQAADLEAGRNIAAPVWAGEAEVTVSGLRRVAQTLLRSAQKTRTAYMHGIERVFDQHGIVPEKHRGDNPEALAGGGEYDMVKVLAMSGETYIAYEKLDVTDPLDHLPLARHRVTVAA